MAEDLQLAAKVHYGFLPDDYEDDRLSIAVTLRPLCALGGATASYRWRKTVSWFAFTVRLLTLSQRHSLRRG